MSVNRKVTVPEGRSERTAVMMRQSKGFGQRGRDVPAASYQRFIAFANPARGASTPPLDARSSRCHPRGMVDDSMQVIHREDR